MTTKRRGLDGFKLYLCADVEEQNFMRDRKEYSAVVSHPFHVFNGIFLTLPLDGIRQTGLRVPLLQEACDEGLDRSETPQEIIERFLEQQGFDSMEQKTDLLFRIIQYVERQVVLVDALEDARYAQLNDLGGAESLSSLMQRVRRHGKEAELKKTLRRLCCSRCFNRTSNTILSRQRLGYHYGFGYGDGRK